MLATHMLRVVQTTGWTRFGVELSDGVNSTSFGRAVRQARADRRMSMRELARRAGISAPYVNEIEKERSRPSLDVVLRVCDALELDSNLAILSLRYRVKANG